MKSLPNPRGLHSVVRVWFGLVATPPSSHYQKCFNSELLQDEQFCSGNHLQNPFLAFTDQHTLAVSATRGQRGDTSTSFAIKQPSSDRIELGVRYW